jgi:NAD-dependent dihydropyrimidine dehydrogenase PreA subunit
MNGDEITARASTAECKGDAGRVVPVVDRNRCEAKAACVALCPFEVFEIRPLEPSDRAALSLRGRVKAWAHGGRQAYVVKPAACHACGVCVQACPEEAIRLVPGPRV